MRCRENNRNGMEWSREYSHGDGIAKPTHERRRNGDEMEMKSRTRRFADEIRNGKAKKGSAMEKLSKSLRWQSESLSGNGTALSCKGEAKRRYGIAGMA